MSGIGLMYVLVQYTCPYRGGAATAERTVAKCDGVRCDAMRSYEKRSEAPSLWALASPPRLLGRK